MVKKMIMIIITSIGKSYYFVTHKVSYEHRTNDVMVDSLEDCTTILYFLLTVVFCLLFFRCNNDSTNIVPADKTTTNIIKNEDSLR